MTSVDLKILLFNKKQVEFAMKALLDLPSHIWYYKVIVTIFLKKRFICIKRDSDHNYMKDSLVSLKRNAASH